ncbi:hypothetical protein DICSQDRAFT_139484 [Dichomitus squalens LYAD-421 SS1]|uniref:Peptidase C14 caspase domain-containing protein n=1 Tax=Dichomitus squalens (strain LYAD-421) TaxID=732165 RepID=R7SQN6_DICSQ|nr:uncharacterized protein DICSQDRAFT_139484 [Dichomitus squalens LYAD-421 SS1]EJF58401.1 hypothetical protein DICSQDRAFT_139484 [Dichomitus squalens LYAD-421 SS1]
MPKSSMFPNIPKVKRSSTSDSARSSRSTKASKTIRRALIIGITYKNRVGETLRSPHTDARAWRQVLIDKYHYKATDITLMLDAEETPKNLVPNKENLLHEIKALVAGARPGDRFMFYYSGHGTQIQSKSINEDDGFDEAIVPYSSSNDVDPILDDVLRELLVDPLPVGAHLTCIFDSCCSGTLLDLDHYACNNVYFPWVNRGKRDLRLTRRAVLRRKTVVDDHIVKVDLKASDEISLTGTDKSHSAALGEPQPCLKICERTRSKSQVILKRDQVINDLATAGATSGRRFIITRSSTLEVPRHGDPVAIEKRKARRVFSIPHKFTFKGIFFKRCAEPETYLPCDGFKCKPESQRPKAHVISISACQDAEQTWESRKGPTMTQSMIKCLSESQRRAQIYEISTFFSPNRRDSLHASSQTYRTSWVRGPYVSGPISIPNEMICVDIIYIKKRH